MSRAIAISDSADARVREYFRLKEGDLGRGIDARSPHGCFICEGHFVVEHLLQSTFDCRSVLVADTKLESLAPLLSRVPGDAPIYTMSERVMTELLGLRFHRGILAAGARKAPLDETGRRVLLEQSSAVIFLEGLTNVDNVGGIFRCASALCPAGSAVALSPGCCDPLYRKSIRVSMGHALRVPFAAMGENAIDELGRAGFVTIALTPSADSMDLQSCARELNTRLKGRKVALLLGAEGPGLMPDTLRQAEIRCRIPQRPGVDSLNVMVAGAIAMSALFNPA
ncbi:MAG: RNA methyltransferase [Phycisphaerales bacterium]|nr:RNA methyltransferase [Planctomycetota bacterium]